MGLLDGKQGEERENDFLLFALRTSQLLDMLGVFLF
jgi:hypothetical protein